MRISLRSGWRASACTPPLSAPGVIEVTLSMKRWVATSVSLTLMSRPQETRCLPSVLQTVSSTQSLCPPMNRVSSPLAASMARRALSAQPTARNLPSGDQLAP